MCVDKIIFFSLSKHLYQYMIHISISISKHLLQYLIQIPGMYLQKIWSLYSNEKSLTSLHSGIFSCFCYKVNLKAMHYGFSYHFSGNGTFVFQINNLTSVFIENCGNLFYMIDNSQNFMPNIFLIKYDQNLQRYLQKT